MDVVSHGGYRHADEAECTVDDGFWKTEKQFL